MAPVSRFLTNAGLCSFPLAAAIGRRLQAAFVLDQQPYNRPQELHNGSFFLRAALLLSSSLPIRHKVQHLKGSLFGVCFYTFWSLT